MAAKWQAKDPDATKNYGMDWSSRQETDGNIISSAWESSSPDLIIEVDPPHAPAIVDGFTICWIRGGVAGETYQVTNRITTDTGLVDDKTARILISEQ